MFSKVFKLAVFMFDPNFVGLVGFMGNELRSLVELMS